VVREIVDAFSAVSDNDDVFKQMYKSDIFQEHIRETMALLEKDPSQLVDPIATYRQNHA